MPVPNAQAALPRFCLATFRQVGMEVWSVLGLSLLIDGYVLVKTFEGIWESKPKNLSFKKHLKNVS